MKLFKYIFFLIVISAIILFFIVPPLSILNKIFLPVNISITGLNQSDEKKTEVFILNQKGKLINPKDILNTNYQEALFRDNPVRIIKEIYLIMPASAFDRVTGASFIIGDKKYSYNKHEIAEKWIVNKDKNKIIVLKALISNQNRSNKFVNYFSGFNSINLCTNLKPFLADYFIYILNFIVLLFLGFVFYKYSKVK